MQLKVDFTPVVFTNLLKTLINQGFAFTPVTQFFSSPRAKAVFLRHDVDCLPDNALALAQIEQELGIRGTFYFRVIDRVFKPDLIKQIIAYGHEIGYHYEEMDFCRGDAVCAIRIFENNLKKFRELYPVKTICMHGSPHSKFDNRDLWGKYDYHDYGIIIEPYFDINFNQVAYYTDTGRRWDGERVSLRDKVVRLQVGSAKFEERCGIEHSDALENINVYSRFHSTFEIIAAAEEGILPKQIMLTVHPQRWHDSCGLWVKELVWQNLKNVVKWGINKVNE